jgi:type III restriction enzyme
MKIQFSATQDYQNQAVQSVVRIFEGQPLAQSSFETTFGIEGASIALTERGIANNLVLDEQQILDNINAIQTENEIKPSLILAKSLSDDKKTTYTRLNFTVEMETGTGKTYTFLRSIYEEPKGTLNNDLIRNVEQMKIDCGEKHFALFKNIGVEYRKVTNIKDLY